MQGADSLLRKLACWFDSSVKTGSLLRRIQRFLSEYSPDSELVARFIFALLPHEPPCRLVLDRTNWKFCNSNMQERIDLMERLVRLFGSESIEFLLADREFVGDKWMEYILTLSIPSKSKKTWKEGKELV